MTNTAWKVVAVLALLVLLLPTAVIGADSLSVPYATHTLNITFSATTGWPTTTEALQPTATAVQTLICGDELSTALECTAFMTVASTNHVALQVSAQSSKVGDSYTIFRTMYDWSEGEGSFPLTKLQSVCAAALQTTLSPLTYTMGSYVAPCRFPDEYQFLPACATDEVPRTILRVYESSGDLQKYFTAAICASPVGCGTGSVLVTAPSLLSDYTTVAISSAPFGLEAALQFVADVRAAYYVSVSASPPPVGNPVAGVGASKVMLQTATTVTMLFATNESGAVADPTITCAASTGFWAFAFIGILPVCFVLFRYSYYRGRHTAKKRARAAIESEERQFLAGGFTTAEENPQPGTTVAAATAAPAADVAAANEIYDQQGDGQWVQENGLWYHVPDGSGEAASYPAKDHEDGLVAADEYAEDAANYMQPEGDDGQQYAQDYAEQEGDYPADQAEQDYSAAQEAGQEYAADQAYEQPNEDEAYYAPQAEEHAQDEEGQYVDPEDIVRSDLVADRPLDGPN